MTTMYKVSKSIEKILIIKAKELLTAGKLEGKLDIPEFTLMNIYVSKDGQNIPSEYITILKDIPNEPDLIGYTIFLGK